MSTSKLSTTVLRSLCRNGNKVRLSFILTLEFNALQLFKDNINLYIGFDFL